MSHPQPHHGRDEDGDSSDTDEPLLMKPKPRRPFELTSPPSSAPSTPPTAATPSAFPPYLQPPTSGSMDGATTPSRTRSFLNLTSSTLFGIYQPTGYAADREGLNTPWGTGAQTPSRNLSRQNSLELSRADAALRDSNGQAPASPLTKTRRRSTAAYQPRLPRRPRPRRRFKTFFLPLLGRMVALFGVGVLYGLLITHLHDRQELAPVKVDIQRSSWTYLTWWGVAGIVLGEALPLVDTLWARSGSEEHDDAAQEEEGDGRRGGWIDAVRSIGAFVGVAFAIRKLPWQSTLQLSLTLALANPAIWYIVDRSPPGFVLAAAFAICGTSVLLGINPALIPSPTPAEVLRGHVMRNGGLVNNRTAGAAASSGFRSEELVLGIFTHESVGVATWIASVLFVSSVCFGNIGRRLAS